MCYRMVQEEMIALSAMAEQINSKLNQQPPPPPLPPFDANNKEALTNGHATPSVGETHQQSNDSVDLDNLFAFLSEVTPNTSANPLLEEISDKMDSLVHDLDVEVLF